MLMLLDRTTNPKLQSQSKQAKIITHMYMYIVFLLWYLFSSNHSRTILICFFFRVEQYLFISSKNTAQYIILSLESAYL